MSACNDTRKMNIKLVFLFYIYFTFPSSCKVENNEYISCQILKKWMPLLAIFA